MVFQGVLDMVPTVQPSEMDGQKLQEKLYTMWKEKID